MDETLDTDSRPPWLVGRGTLDGLEAIVNLEGGAG
jgi:hypothetical protein